MAAKAEAAFCRTHQEVVEVELEVELARISIELARLDENEPTDV